MGNQSKAREALLDIILRLEGAAVPRALTAPEIEALSGIPVCEPFLSQLRQITGYLKEGRLPGTVLIEDAGTRFDSISLANVRIYGRGGTPAGEQAFVEIRAGGASTGFFIGQPFQVSPEGFPLNLERYEVPASAASGNLGLRFVVKDRPATGCTTRYNLEFRDGAARTLAEVEFSVFEGTCGR